MPRALLFIPVILAGLTSPAEVINRWLPMPVEALAEELDRECRANGLGDAITSDDYASPPSILEG